MLKTVIGMVTGVTALVALLVGLVRLRHECGERDFAACAQYVLSGLPTAGSVPVGRPATSGQSSPAPGPVSAPASVPTVPRPAPPISDRVPPNVVLPWPGGSDVPKSDAPKPDRLCVFLGAKMNCEDPKPR